MHNSPPRIFDLGGDCTGQELVNNHKKMLVVQKTGWGKSAVYFISTKLLRQQGRGPSIIISPLIALMRNQIDSAKRLGLDIVTWIQLTRPNCNSCSRLITPSYIKE